LYGGRRRAEGTRKNYCANNPNHIEHTKRIVERMFFTGAELNHDALYFRWRTCRFGAEEYWHGILDHDGIPRRRYREIREVSEELQKAAPYIERTFVKLEVAIVLVYDNLWALDLEVVYGEKNCYGIQAWEPTSDCYRALYARNILVDFMNPDKEKMNDYSVIFIPSLTLLTRRLRKTKSYVKKDGIIFALNYNDKALRIPCNGREFKGIISGEKIKDILKIKGRDARILKTI